MTQSEDIFDAQWDGIEECRCRVRLGFHTIGKAVMTSERKTTSYSDEGTTDDITFRVKFRVADMPKNYDGTIDKNLIGKTCEVERGGEFRPYRVFMSTDQGGIMLLDVGGVNG